MNERIEPGRTFAQRDCRIEPGFDASDNLTFFTGDIGSRYVMHKASEICIDDIPHLFMSCGYYLEKYEM